jgi:3-oxoacyl-[acyl-carrier protein] reductase
MADGIRLDGKVAVVTGAGRGLGRAYAEALAAYNKALKIRTEFAEDNNKRAITLKE